MQSLKLKFKKEENHKCKDEQELNIETGKSIVHVTNEDLKSSEMVFICIPKTEASVKIIPKKKLKVDIKENAIQKDYETINQIKSDTVNLDNFNSDVIEKNIEIKTEVFSDQNDVNDVSKELKKELNFLPSSVVIDNITEADIQYEKYQIPNQIKVEFTNDTIKGNFSENNQSINEQQQSLEKSNNLTIKQEFSDDLDIGSISNKKQCDDHNTPIKLTESNFFASTTRSDINETLLDKNITIKSEAIDNLSECYVHVRNKRDNNESEKQMINKWTIDEDKIILQTCKRVEDIEVLLETINRRIPQRSVSEVWLFLNILNII